MSAAPPTRWDPRLERRRSSEHGFRALTYAATGLAILALVTLLADIGVRGVPHLDLAS